jgi:hypothetical protein
MTGRIPVSFVRHTFTDSQFYLLSQLFCGTTWKLSTDKAMKQSVKRGPFVGPSAISRAFSWRAFKAVHKF